MSAFQQASCLSKNSQGPLPLPQILPEVEDVNSLSQRTYATDGYNTNQTNLITYLHVPQSGSGFATVVAHHVCGSDIPDDVFVREPKAFFEKWGPTCNASRFGRFESGHSPLTPTDMGNLGSVVAMFREPSQRIISGYFNDLYGCTKLQQKHECIINVNGSFVCEGDLRDENGRFVRNPSTISVFEYGKCMENCTANMLTGRACGTRGPVDVERAIEVVDELGFVGITEEWNLSLCLWHARFGGRVLPAELMNVRPGPVTASLTESQKYDEIAMLKHWYPETDGHVVHAAEKRFWNDLDLHGIDRKSCQQMMSELVEEQSYELFAGEQTSEELVAEQAIRAASETTLLSYDVDPIYYLHVPETGAGFATTVAHHGCVGAIPEDVSVVEPSEFFDAWGSVCSSSRFAYFQSGHDPLPVNLESFMSHVVVMFRDPSQRILSGYYNGFHDCMDLQEKYSCVADPAGNLKCEGDVRMRDGSFMRDPERAPPIEYASCVENCTTNMLTGRRCEDKGPSDVERAEEIIDEIGFVGLSEEWALSVCLWHRKYGGRMLPAELANSRPGVITTLSGGSSKYDTQKLLGDWRPKAERRVYTAATNRFWKDVSQFGVDRRACEREAASLVDSV
jgi:hypothetical protein